MSNENDDHEKWKADCVKCVEKACDTVLEHKRREGTRLCVLMAIAVDPRGPALQLACERDDHLLVSVTTDGMKRALLEGVVEDPTKDLNVRVVTLEEPPAIGEARSGWVAVAADQGRTLQVQARDKTIPWSEGKVAKQCEVPSEVVARFQTAIGGVKAEPWSDEWVSELEALLGPDSVVSTKEYPNRLVKVTSAG